VLRTRLQSQEINCLKKWWYYCIKNSSIAGDLIKGVNSIYLLVTCNDWFSFIAVFPIDPPMHYHQNECFSINLPLVNPFSDSPLFTVIYFKWRNIARANKWNIIAFIAWSFLAWRCACLGYALPIPSVAHNHPIGTSYGISSGLISGKGSCFPNLPLFNKPLLLRLNLLPTTHSPVDPSGPVWTSSP